MWKYSLDVYYQVTLGRCVRDASVSALYSLGPGPMKPGYYLKFLVSFDLFLCRFITLSQSALRQLCREEFIAFSFCTLVLDCELSMLDSQCCGVTYVHIKRSDFVGVIRLWAGIESRSYGIQRLQKAAYVTEFPRPSVSSV